MKAHKTKKKEAVEAGAWHVASIGRVYPNACQ